MSLCRFALCPVVWIPRRPSYLGEIRDKGKVIYRCNVTATENINEVERRCHDEARLPA